MGLERHGDPDECDPDHECQHQDETFHGIRRLKLFVAHRQPPARWAAYLWQRTAACVGSSGRLTARSWTLSLAPVWTGDSSSVAHSATGQAESSVNARGMLVTPRPVRHSRLRRVWNIVCDLLIATAVIWALPVLLAAVRALVMLIATIG